MQDRIFFKKIESLKEEGRLRELKSFQSMKALFSLNDYLGLSTHPYLKKKVKEAIDRFGISARSARLLNGSLPLHDQLESEFAKFMQRERALLFNSGYAANLAIFSSILSRDDIVFTDKLIHASIIDGIRLSGSKLVRFDHNDHLDLEKKIIKHRSSHPKMVLVTEAVFSMDGDTPDLAIMADIAKRYDMIFALDEAHSFGLYSKHGKGMADKFGILDKVDIHIVTFGKSLGSSGAIVTASSCLIDYLLNFGRSFIYSTAQPIPSIAAAMASLEIIRSDEGDSLRNKLFENVKRIRSFLASNKFETIKADSPIVALFPSDHDQFEKILKLSKEKKIYLPKIVSPTVPKGKERFRISIQADHDDEALSILEDVLLLSCSSD